MKSSYLQIGVQRPAVHTEGIESKHIWLRIKGSWLVEKHRLIEAPAAKVCCRHLMLAGLEAEFSSTRDLDAHIAPASFAASSKAGM